MLVKRVSTGEIINSTVLKEAGDSSAKPCGFVVYNKTTLFGAEGYGYYLFYITKDGANQGSDYLFYKPLGVSSIAFDEETYYQGDVATISYSIDSADFVAYDYYVKVYDETYTAVYSEEVTSPTGYVQWDTSNIDSSGFYTVILQAVGSSYDLAFDDAQVLKTINIKGTTYDAKNGSVLGGVDVSFKQGGTFYNTTSNATTGNYSVTQLISGIETSATASKTGYTHNDFTFTLPTTGSYTMNLYLMPEDLPDHTIGGLVRSYPLYQAVSDATVNIWKSGWSNSTTTSSLGYYEFTNISWDQSTITNETFNSSAYDSWVSLAHSYIVTDSELVSNTTDETPYTKGTDYNINYTDGKIQILSTGNMTNYTEYHIDYNYETSTNFWMNATKAGYKEIDDVYVSANAVGYTKQDFLLHPSYTLTVRARDQITGAYISEFTATLDDGTETNTTNGVATFTELDWGYYLVTVSSENYYAGYKTILLQDNTEIEVSLTRTGEGGTGVQYPPQHLVEFCVVDVMGRPYPDINVTAQGQETTMGSFDWLYSLFGFSQETPIHNVSMNGTTDSQGSISFLMVETIKYKVTLSKPSQGINETIYIYPKDERYTIVLGLKGSPSTYENISINFSTSEVNATHRFFNVSYQDLSNHTDHLGFYVYTKPVDSTENTTELYNETLTGINAYNFSYLASEWKGQVFYVKCNATYNDTYYEPVEQTKGFMYYLKKRLIDLGFDEAHDWYYNAISVALLVLIGAMFSGITVKYGAVITPGTALSLWWIGWLSVPGAVILLPTAFVIGVLYYMSESAKEEGMT